MSIRYCCCCCCWLCCWIATSSPSRRPSAAAIADWRRRDRKINAIISTTDPTGATGPPLQLSDRASVGQVGVCTSHNGRNNYWPSPVVRSSRSVSPLPFCQLFVVLINRKIINTLDVAGTFFQAPSAQNGDIFPDVRRIIQPPPLAPPFHLTTSGRQHLMTPARWAGDGDGTDWRWRRFAGCLRARVGVGCCGASLTRRQPGSLVDWRFVTIGNALPERGEKCRLGETSKRPDANGRRLIIIYTTGG